MSSESKFDDEHFNCNSSASDDDEIVAKIFGQPDDMEDDLIDDNDEHNNNDNANNEKKDDDDDENGLKDDSPRPISERWSPLGANYDDNNCQMDDLLIDTSANSSQTPSHALPYGESGDCESSSTAALAGGDSSIAVNLHRLKSMEEEQELLTTSLLALTSHFAHVQFRVRQIVEAPSNERDTLLKDLEEFAFRGIPEIESFDISSPPPAPSTVPSDSDSVDSPSTTLDRTRQRQCELIERLKGQLTELEKIAYESGAPVLPQSILLEKQKIIIDELKSKLHLNVSENDLPQLSSEDLKCQVDSAISDIIGPLKMKDQLVAQLKTQITDLERFIAFLQCDSDAKLADLDEAKLTEMAYNSYAVKKKASDESKRTTTFMAKESIESSSAAASHTSGSLKTSMSGSVHNDSLNSKAHSLLDKAATILQMFAIAQFVGCKSNRFQKNSLKRTQTGNHWGDTRAQLEVDIQEIASLAATLQCDREKLAALKAARRKSRLKLSTESDYSTDSDSDGINDFYRLGKFRDRLKRNTHQQNTSDSIATLNIELTTAVRKNFVITLQKLIQHGLRAQNDTSTVGLIVPFMGCFRPPVDEEWSPPAQRQQHMNQSNQIASMTSAPTRSTRYQSRNSTNPSTSAASDDDDDDSTRRQNDNYDMSLVDGRQMHAWELILEYYNLKNGDDYNETPARKLSQSFNLDIVGSRAVSNKEGLLSTIGTIIAIHSPYKRSYNALFKAFICAGLNSHKLVPWLNLIFSCTELVNTYYTSWSYVANTGFRDALRSIDCLTKYDFDLPVDLAIRQFHNIKDIFM